MASFAFRDVDDNNAPVYQGFINWIGFYESDEETFTEIDVADYWGVGERFGIAPIIKRKAYWAGGVSCDNIVARNSTECKTELTSIFSNWPQPIPKMIRHTPVERIKNIYVHDHNPIQE